MYKEPKPMREIHSIQEKLYKETKNLSSKERLEHLRKKAAEAKKRWGLKLRKASRKP